MVADRMSWASNRVTTRLEDKAYCLLGIFKVNMPLLYGEGDKAFIRLQEEIMKTSEDRSLFAWCEPNVEKGRIWSNLEYWTQSHSLEKANESGLLASSPACFNLELTGSAAFGIAVGTYRLFTDPYFMTNKGLCITLEIAPFDPFNDI